MIWLLGFAIQAYTSALAIGCWVLRFKHIQVLWLLGFEYVQCFIIFLGIDTLSISSRFLRLYLFPFRQDASCIRRFEGFEIRYVAWVVLFYSSFWVYEFDSELLICFTVCRRNRVFH